MRRWVEALSRATQTPAALAALLTLAVLAAAAATRVAVRVRAGWIEPVNLFIAVALGPANRKSAVFAACTAPLEAYERAELERVGPELAAQQSALKIKRKELEALERKAAGVDDRLSVEEKRCLGERAAALARELAATPVPEPPRLLVDDCSPEKLVNLLAAQGGRIAVLSPEGGVFGMMAGRYSAANQPNLDVYLKGHAGDPLRVDRVGRAPDQVAHPALTIGLAVQPGVIRQLAEKPEFRERGVPARFLYGLPRSWVGRRRIAAPPVPDEVRERYDGVVTRVLGLPRQVDERGDPNPFVLAMSVEADAALRAFEATVETRLGEQGDLGHIADWGGKLVGAVARIAGLLHLAAHAGTARPWEVAIAGDQIDAVVAIAERFLIPHAQTAFLAMGADPGLEAARRLLGWLERTTPASCSLREAHQELRKHGLTTAQVATAAGLLVEHGYLRPAPMPAAPITGRPPSPRFQVNPVWAAQKAHKAQNPGNGEDAEPFEPCEAFEEDVPPKDGAEADESNEDPWVVWEESL